MSNHSLGAVFEMLCPNYSDEFNDTTECQQQQQQQQQQNNNNNHNNNNNNNNNNN